MNPSPPSLLDRVRGLLERTYRVDSGLGDLAPFVIGDRGYRMLAARGVHQKAPSYGLSPLRGATLVRETAQGLRASIYFPDELIRCLEAFPPQAGLTLQNVEAFAIFVEEIDHLLVIAERSCQARPVTMFELELHANVSKHLVLARYLAGRAPRLGELERLWLRRQIFGKGRYCDEDPEVRARYRDASHWAVRLLDAAAGLDPRLRVESLRRFHTAGAGGKLQLISDLAA